MKLAFLVYDSRSGSTLLSREIASRMPGVYVTPEVRFDRLLGRSPGWWRRHGPERVAALLDACRVPEKLNLARESVQRVAAAHRAARPLVEALLTEARRLEGAGVISTAVVKSGLHLRAARRVLADIPDARFVFIVRDPRAAIASKLTTARPYHPGQTMAWAGAFYAALQWRQYARRARALRGRAPLHALTYESVIERHDEALQGIARFLDSGIGAAAGAYRIPPAEHAIHARVLAGGVDAGRAQAWRESLAPRDQAVIELVCAGEMRRFGYAPELRIGALRAAGLLAGAAAASAGHIVAEGARRLARRLRGRR